MSPDSTEFPTERRATAQHDPAVPLDVRLRLAHACLEHLAAGAGARLLHIKGVALHPVLAEGRSGSTDCDVLVHPSDLTAFLAALADAGWEQRTRFEHGSVFRHAATWYHAVWGTVDVHRSFPGMDRDAVATFEELWRAREEVELGGVLCAVPELRGQRLILLVHAARDAMGRRAHDVRVAWTEAGDDERTALDALAERLGGTVPLALATDRPELAQGQRGEATWRAVQANENPTVVWRARIRDARGPLAKARVLLEASRINRDHLELRLGHAPTRAEMRREWWDRWRRGWQRLRR